MLVHESLGAAEAVVARRLYLYYYVCGLWTCIP